MDPFTTGSILLTTDLIALKRENTESILTVKRIKWRKIIDVFCHSVEADPTRVGKKNIYFCVLGIYQALHM